MSLIQIPQSLTHEKLTKIDAFPVSGQLVDVVSIASAVIKPEENSLRFDKNNTQILSQLPSNTLLALKNIGSTMIYTGFIHQTRKSSF